MDIKGFLRGLVGELLPDQQMSEEHFKKILSEIEDKIDNEPPPSVAFMGDTGVGKSSTSNSLFNAGAAVSHYEACTAKATKFEAVKGVLIAYDMPGLGESRLKQKEHIALYEEILKKVDVALWILDGQNRAIAQTQDYLEIFQKISPKLINRMVIALNKIDLIHPGETDWHPLANLPSEKQEENIQRRINDVTKHIKEVLPNWKGQIIAYSANKRYNLPHLFDAIMDAVPDKRRWVVASRKALADFLEFVDPRLLPPEKRQERLQNQQPQVSTISDIVANMPTEEFAKFSSNKEAFQKWLAEKEKGL